MNTFIFSFALVDAFLKSDLMGKFIVVALFVLSFFCLSKVLFRHSVYKATDAEHKHLDSLYKQRVYPGAMIYDRLSNGVCNVEIYKSVMLELIKCLDKRGMTKDQLRNWNGETPMPTLTQQELSKIKVVAENELGTQLRALERDLNFIGTISVLAPSLGLFGTVWGVLLSFMSMADGSGAAIITNVAPGIGGALLTTVVGLIVSIPTTFVYNKLCTNLRTYTGQAENFVDKLIADIYLYHSPKENSGQNIQLAVVPQQPQYTAQENYEVGGKYNA